MTSLLLALTLTAGGTEIVHAPAAPRTVRYAAEELSAFLSKAFDTTVPIVTNPTLGKVSLVLGTNAWSAVAGVDLRDLKRDGYVIRAKGTRVFLAGEDDPKVDMFLAVNRCAGDPDFARGTYNAVIGFLERFAGCRFYFPGDLGTVVPKCRAFTVPDGTDIRDEPYYSVRYWSYWRMGRWHETLSPSEWGRYKMLERIRLKMDTRHISVAHGSARLAYPERFAKSHPEYFALMADGSRLSGSAFGPKASYRSSQFCYSSGVWDELYKDALSFFRGEDASVRGIVAASGRGHSWNQAGAVERKYFDIMPQDGLQRCQCAKCRAIDRPAGQWARDIIWNNTVAMANRLKAEGVKGTLAQMAYGAYREMPPIDIPDNVAVMLAERGPWAMHTPARFAEEMKEIRDWGTKLHGNLWLWNYAGKFDCFDFNLPNIPQMAPRVTGAYYKLVKDLVFGAYLEIETDLFLFDYLNLYVFSRVMWDPSVDVEAILAEHDRLMFGAGAAEMGEFFRILEEKWIDGIVGKTRDTALGPVPDVPSEFDLWMTVYTPDTLKRLDLLLKTAEGKTVGDEMSARRVRLMRDVMFTPFASRGRAYQKKTNVAEGLAWNRAHPTSSVIADDPKLFYPPNRYVDTNVFLTPPHSIRLTATNNAAIAYVFNGENGRMRLKPATRYRISYLLKTDLEPLSRGGGAFCDFIADRSSGGRRLVFPGGIAPSGKRDWMRQEFEFDTPAAMPQKPPFPELNFRVRNARGSAWFDEVRLDEVDVSTRVFRPERHVLGDTSVRRLQPIDEASWIWRAGLDDEVQVAPPRYYRFRKIFDSPGGTARIDVSADERFVLFIDGAFVGRGPNRGSVGNWMYETYDIDVPAGKHVIEAVVWRIGLHAPIAQLSYRGGFILKADGAFDALLTTGKADWEVGEIKGTVGDWNLPRAGVWGGGAPFHVKGTGFLDEQPASYGATTVARRPIRPPERSTYGYGAREPGWQLFPSQLKDQTEKTVRPGSLKTGHLTGSFAARTKTEVIWDLEDYYCAYPLLVTKGGRGSKVTWGWAEGMRRGEKEFKTYDRREWKDCLFVGFTDEFLPDGRARGVFTTPWWRCGRWVKIVVETGDEPLEIADAALIESRYPLEDESAFACDDETMPAVRQICRRAMQMCAHEMLFDCPFYEQQMYPGDTRIQLRAIAAMTRDDRLIRRAIEIFDYARRPNGLVPMNFPTRGHQESATFSMCHLMMYADYARYHDNREWLRARLPGMRNTLDGIAAYEDNLSLIAGLPGWSFIDWVPTWTQGVAPDGHAFPASAINNLYWTMVKMNAAYVERALGHEAEAVNWEASARKTLASVERFFWDEKRGLFADTVRHDVFSEHAQVLAILTGLLDEARAKKLFETMIAAKDLAQCTVSFDYYYFQVLFKYGRADLFDRRLDLWREYVARDLKTTMERPDRVKTGEYESRSDCHAWGAHPLAWMQRGLAGVESAAPFFAKVRVAPCPGKLKRIQSKMPHPRGFVETDLTFDGEDVTGTVTLPDGVTGEFVWLRSVRPLVSGVNDLSLPKTIPLEGGKNLRDIGGWRALDGRRVCTGRIYRSAAFNKPAKGGKAGAAILTEAGRRMLVEKLGVKTDLDLRTDSEVGDLAASPLGPTVSWRHISSKGYGRMLSDEATAAFAEDFALFLEPTNYPIVVHCAGGADRTGTLVFLLNGLLGVSPEDLRADWQHTARAFDDWPGCRFEKGLDELMACLAAYPGASLREKIEAYVLARGFTRADIAR